MPPPFFVFHTGAHLARLPVEPMYGKVLLASGQMGCSEEALAVVAMVSTDVVFHQPRCLPCYVVLCCALRSVGASEVAQRPSTHVLPQR